MTTKKQLGLALVGIAVICLFTTVYIGIRYAQTNACTGLMVFTGILTILSGFVGIMITHDELD